MRDECELNSAKLLHFRNAILHWITTAMESAVAKGLRGDVTGSMVLAEAIREIISLAESANLNGGIALDVEAYLALSSKVEDAINYKRVSDAALAFEKEFPE